MTLPNAVKKQAEQADDFIQNGEKVNTDTPADPTKEELDAKKETPVVQASEDDKTKEQVLDKPLGDESDPWEKKYQTLQGKYNKEVPQLHKQVRDLTEKLKGGADTGELEKLHPLQCLQRCRAAHADPIDGNFTTGTLRDDQRLQAAESRGLGCHR